MPEGLRKPDEEEEVLPWEFVLVLWAGVTEEEEFSKAIGIFLEQINQGATSNTWTVTVCRVTSQSLQQLTAPGRLCSLLIAN